MNVMVSLQMIYAREMKEHDDKNKSQMQCDYRMTKQLWPSSMVGQVCKELKELKKRVHQSKV